MDLSTPAGRNTDVTTSENFSPIMFYFITTDAVIPNQRTLVGFQDLYSQPLFATLNYPGVFMCILVYTLDNEGFPVSQ